MARLVLDTNSLIQCIARRSHYHAIWLSLLDGRNSLCVSNEILEEYEEILERKASHTFAMLAINVIINNPYTVFITPYYHFNLITVDFDDNKFVGPKTITTTSCKRLISPKWKSSSWMR